MIIIVGAIITKLLNYIYEYDRYYDYYDFESRCCDGDLNKAKWIIDNYDIDIHTHNEYCFRYSCRNGHLNIAMWLIDNFPIK